MFEGLKDKSCEEFITILGSRSPELGGGGATALVGGMGTALGNMVASLTVGKEQHAHVQQDLIRLKSEAERLQKLCLSLIDRDSEVLINLIDCYKYPSNTEEDIEIKSLKIEEALRDATLVPLELMGNSSKAIELHQQLLELGNITAISDIGVGVLLCKAALIGASLNVKINTKEMRDRDFAEKLSRESEAFLEKYVPIADEIYDNVEKLLR